MSNSFKLFPTHFSRGAKNIMGERSPPSPPFAPLVTGVNRRIMNKLHFMQIVTPSYPQYQTKRFGYLVGYGLP